MNNLNLCTTNFKTMKHDETKKAIARERRKQLSELSHQLKIANIMLLQMDASITINDLLIRYYEKQAGAPLDLNTYEQWRERGYQVRKGSVSFMVWGKPLKHQRTEKPTDPATDTDTEKDQNEDFFPVCHLFDKSQCYALKADEIK